MAKKKRIQPEKKSNRTLIYAGLAVLLLIAVLAVYFHNAPAQQGSPGKLPTAGNFAELNRPSTYEPGKVKITEFARFSCIHCYTLNQQMPAIKQKYGDKLEITFKPMLWRNFPQDSGLQKSNEAYILAERMGKGEEMKDAIFKAMFVDNKDITSEAVLEDIGRSVGLGDEFVKALNNGDAKDEADADIRLAESYQVDETPTIIINGNLKATPPTTSTDKNATINNLDTIINSLLS